MNAHNMFVDVSVRAVINCSLPLLHGLCIRYYCLLLMLCRFALFHRTNINEGYCHASNAVDIKEGYCHASNGVDIKEGYCHASNGVVMVVE